MKNRLLIALSCALTACSTPRSIGYFDGTYTLKPYQPVGCDKPAKHEFIFKPDSKAPLRYICSNGKIITPGPMWTDGGSVPSAVSWLPSFGRWHYAEAYILHDWLMTEHRMERGNTEPRVPNHVQEIFDEALQAEAQQEHYLGERISRFLISHFANHGKTPCHHWNGRQPDPLKKWEPR